MSELRYNVITRDWVIIATERTKRPQDFRKSAAQAKTPTPRRADCPFCPGNEVSGEETFRIGSKDSWKARSIYNKYPALSPNKSCGRNITGIYNSMEGYGFHEVMVENPRHDMTIALMSDEEAGVVVDMYRNRYTALNKMKYVKSVTVFKNHGEGAGASIEHPHSQVVATPMVPPLLRSRMEQAAHYYDFAGKCLFCDVMDQEMGEGKRIVLETDKFVSFVPYAAAAPFLMLVFPKEHKPSFGQMSDAEAKDLARHLRIVLAKLYKGLGNPDFNLTIRSVPAGENGVEYYHWFINIVPRIFQPAGFELGSGIYINIALPEESAEFLRQVSIK